MPIFVQSSAVTFDKPTDVSIHASTDVAGSGVPPEAAAAEFAAWLQVVKVELLWIESTKLSS
ncbi:MAG: hypothetical protein WBH97_08215 [Rectinemataceae bacterium]